MSKSARSSAKGPKAATARAARRNTTGRKSDRPKSAGRDVATGDAPPRNREVLPSPDPEPPRLPPGRPIDLPGRGRIYFREIPGPENAPVVLLLHGWLASGALNWATAFDTLGQHFRVIAPDQRGHGRGIRSWSPFRLEDCADDAAALLDALGIEHAVAVGYSMGGPVAQLLWRRHPGKVAGLVLCATSGEPVTASSIGRLVFNTLLFGAAGTVRIGQLATRVPIALAESITRPFERKQPPLDLRFTMAELGRHDVRMLLEAGVALGRYRANDWLRDIDVPTAIVVTTEDRTVLPEGQMRQALEIRDVRIFCVDGGHIAIGDPGFVEHLRVASLHVALRAASAVRSSAARARRRKAVERTVEALLARS
jgi:pimeloyl-ACP methyl ester carboxylesterase